MRLIAVLTRICAPWPYKRTDMTEALFLVKKMTKKNRWQAYLQISRSSAKEISAFEPIFNGPGKRLKM